MNKIIDKIKLNLMNKKVDDLQVRLTRICKELCKTCDLNVADVYGNGFNTSDGRHLRTIYIQDLFEVILDDKFYYCDLEITIVVDKYLDKITFEFTRMIPEEKLEEVSKNYKIDDMLHYAFVDCCYKKYAETTSQLWLLNDQERLYSTDSFEFDYHEPKKEVYDMDYNAVISLLIHIYKAAKKCGGKSIVYPKGY